MKLLNKIKVLVCSLILITSCTIEEQVNPNAPTVEDIINNPTKTKLNNLVTGALASMRTGYGAYITATGTIARELYLFDADPRNTTDLIGTTGSLDNNTFYTTAPWVGRYTTIKNLSIILQALPNTGPEFSDEELQGYRAFAYTIMAHQFLMLINAQDVNGIRVDVSDPDNLGPIVSKTEAFTEIATLLNDGYDELNGAEFAFPLTTGFAGFDTPATFGEFNRALAARVALYRGLYNDALGYLADSFIDENGDLTVGPKMVFSTAGPDILNPLFKTPQQSGDQIIVNDHFVDDAEPGDLRVANKTAERDNKSAKSGLNGDFETRLYASSTSPIDIIRNEELILIYAECLIQTDDLVNGEAALDIIRESAGLDDIATAKPVVSGDKDLLIDEMLNQRRYSLWGEGHRFIDLRRYNRLNDTYVIIDPIFDEDNELIPQEIFTEFPIPATENVN